MTLGQRLNWRRWFVVAHDVSATMAALLLSLYLRFGGVGLDRRGSLLILVLPCFFVYASGVYWFFDLYRSKWRFASLPDLANIVRASAVLALSLLVLDYVLLASYLFGGYVFGKLTIALYFVLQIFFLGGGRVGYRWFRLSRTRRRTLSSGTPVSTLILGRAADTEVLLRSIESGAVCQLAPAGILSPSQADQGQTVRGVPVLGRFGDLQRVSEYLTARGAEPRRIVLAPSAFEAGTGVETALMMARRLGITTNRMPSLDEGGQTMRLAPVAVEDLLLRPSATIDGPRLEAFVAGRAVAVTGGGGSIGAEVCDRVVRFGAARLLVIENSEPALHAVMEGLRAKAGDAVIEGRIADIRDRDRIERLFRDFKPDLVFHAAALKHVPILENDWEEGVKTNVFGSVNVADAAARTGVRGMVMISTDKAIEPVSVLGATKRFAEMYCQALDAELLRRPAAAPMRLIAVRFGNVLASNGSVIPKFKAQIEAGGPVTVTHPDMVRYFMTIREACDLVLTAASHALGPERSDVSIYVLNMGQPIKIVDLAERMIRLSGLEPGRDVAIEFTGMRPGERLNEILFAREEPTLDIGVPGVLAAKPVFASLDVMKTRLATLERALAGGTRDEVLAVLRDAIPDFKGQAA
ncbi:capsular biosynthesis protein [Rhodoplanes elegans]|uniref:Capsular biosynthesis protein n=1 Tax=Rhodoplanes elegans TaxID=29408 RepID=A0A327KKX1_9BRAD|nr:nucleoside-diphosphate sugar epimerase/dehydratase [Rhodoplanes elegans]MBK5959732.1 capsular biosynthesis protein [Rhodoplanes elegans]RAI39409.1 capsular biosynthesis protein [Rhodoplanes elegans]